MEPCKKVKAEPKAAEVATPKLQIVKLEERVAPGFALNHSEKMVREPAKGPAVRKKEPKPKLQIIKLEERIAPALSTNHNETLVRETKDAKPSKEEPKPKLQIVKLEERIALALTTNHNETLLRDHSPNTR